jgi:hypothetical protein
MLSGLDFKVVMPETNPLSTKCVMMLFHFYSVMCEHTIRLQGYFMSTPIVRMKSCSHTDAYQLMLDS